MKIIHNALACVTQLVGVLPHTPKGAWFNSWSVQIPRFQVQSPVGAHGGGNLSVFLSHISVLPPLLLSQKKKRK